MTVGCATCPVVEVRTWHKGQQRLSTLQVLASSIEHNPGRARPDQSPSVSVILASADKIRKCSACKAQLSNVFHIPDLWWSEWCRAANGYFGCDDITNDAGEFVGVCAWARFIAKRIKTKGDARDYYWWKLNVFSEWNERDKHTSIIVFFQTRDEEDKNKRAEAEALASTCLKNINERELDDPFWMYARLGEEVVRIQDRAIWETRDLVRTVEKQRQKKGKHGQPRAPDYLHLHDIARHTLHVSETLTVAGKMMDSMRNQHKDFQERRLVGSQSHWDVHNRLSFHHSILSSLLHRSESNNSRLQGEIGLAFNTVTQGIANETMADSASMKTIAFVTMFFLPATFVSAVFSTSFFSFDAQQGTWSVSAKFWVYWAVSIPLTLASGAFWVWGRVMFPAMSELLDQPKDWAANHDWHELHDLVVVPGGLPK